MVGGLSKQETVNAHAEAALAAACEPTDSVGPTDISKKHQDEGQGQMAQGVALVEGVTLFQ